MVNPSIAQINELLGEALQRIRTGIPIPEILTILLNTGVYNHFDLSQEQALALFTIAQQDYVNNINLAPTQETVQSTDQQNIPADPHSILEEVTDNEGGEYTDLKLALRISESFGQRIRYCPSWSKETPWFYYDGARWTADQRAYIHRCYHHIMYTCIAEMQEQIAHTNESDPAGSKFIDTLTKTMARLESANKHNSTLSKLEKIDNLVVTPNDFDVCLTTLNIQNCTYNLGSHTLQTHAPGDMITKLAPVDYNIEAQCPGFYRFLERIQPETEMRAFLQRWFGYCLTGLTSEQCLLIFYGSGQNGKSVITNLMTKIMGDYALTFEMEVFSDKLSDKADLIKAQMRGARLVSAVETQRSGVKLNEGLVKRLTGGDEVIGRVLYGMPFRYIPTYKVILSLNHPPIIDDTTHSMWRRIYQVPFAITIPDEERDKGLEDRLLREEREGILLWMLEGLREYQRVGLQPPETVLIATALYREEQDIHADFIPTCLELDVDKQNLTLEHEVQAEDLRKAYLRWCDSTHIRPKQPQIFPSWMREHGIFQRKLNGKKFYRGVLVKTEWITFEDSTKDRSHQHRF